MFNVLDGPTLVGPSSERLQGVRASLRLSRIAAAPRSRNRRDELERFAERDDVVLWRWRGSNTNANCDSLLHDRASSLNRPASARAPKPIASDCPRSWSRLLLARLALARPIALPARDPRTLFAEMSRTLAGGPNLGPRAGVV